MISELCSAAGLTAVRFFDPNELLHFCKVQGRIAIPNNF
jgi:hypothetical protein